MKKHRQQNEGGVEDGGDLEEHGDEEEDGGKRGRAVDDGEGEQDAAKKVSPKSDPKCQPQSMGP